MKIYLDGCSLTYGQGLPRDKSIGQLLVSIGNHQVLDKSRPAKSNQAIIFDTWNNRNDHDVYFLGFTYSNRYHIKFRNLDIDLYPYFFCCSSLPVPDLFQKKLFQVHFVCKQNIGLSYHLLIHLELAFF